MRNSLASRFIAPALLPGAFIQCDCGGLTFLTAIENQEIAIKDRGIAVAMLSTEFERLRGPYLFARKIEAADIDFVATLERSINVFTIGSWGRRGAAVFRMHFFAFGGQC